MRRTISALTSEDTAVSIDVLANDSDPDGDMLSVADASAGNGSVKINSDGTITYTPNANINGHDSINYTISDGHGGTDAATVAVTVTPVNDAPITQDDVGVAHSPVTIDVLANDSDPDGDALSVTAASAPNGTVVINNDNTVTYNPDDGFIGQDTLTYIVSDGNGGAATGKAVITVDSSVDPYVPVGGNAVFAEGEHEFNRSTSSAVILPNDASYELTEGTVELTFNADTVSLARQGLLTKDAKYFGDGGHFDILLEGNDVYVRLQSTNADYVILAKDAVVANTDYHVAVTFGGDGMKLYLNGDLVGTNDYTGGLVGNEEPLVIGANEWASGDKTANKLLDAFGGTIGKVFIYDHALSAHDIGILASGDFTNNAPQAVDDTVKTSQDTAVTINPLANDSDPDGQALLIGDLTGAEHGQLVHNDDGSVTYTPDAGFSGTDTFQYTVTDGMVDSTATVSVAVGDGWLI